MQLILVNVTFFFLIYIHNRQVGMVFEILWSRNQGSQISDLYNKSSTEQIQNPYNETKFFILSITL
jgi:hypothetical protein